MLKGKIKKKLESVITCSYFNKKMYTIIILYYYFRFNLNFGVYYLFLLTVHYELLLSLIAVDRSTFLVIFNVLLLLAIEG